MSDNLSTLKVGDKAIVVSPGGSTTEVTVTSVGRKWIVTDLNKPHKVQFSVENGKEKSIYNNRVLRTLEQNLEIARKVMEWQYAFPY